MPIDFTFQKLLGAGNIRCFGNIAALNRNLCGVKSIGALGEFWLVVADYMVPDTEQNVKLIIDICAVHGVQDKGSVAEDRGANSNMLVFSYFSK